MMNSIMNQLTINTFAFSTLSRQELEALFNNFIQAKLVVKDCNGNETSFEVMEMFDRQTTLCDEDGIEIQEEIATY